MLARLPSNMSGVDRGEQRIEYYNIWVKHSRRSRKRVFAYLIECCFLNVYIVLSFVNLVYQYLGVVTFPENCPGESFDWWVFL